MGLQEQIAEAIIIAFDELGGDPQDAVDAATQHDTVDSWLQQETTKIAIAGGVEAAIPGFAMLAIPAGISYLLHKMAHISWGIGAIRGCYVVETPQYSDLRNILTLWANSSYYNAHIIDYMAVGIDAFEYALTDDGQKALDKAVKKVPQDEPKNVVLKTLEVVQLLTYDFGADERAQRLVQSITGEEHLQELVVRAKDNVPENSNKNVPLLNRRISTKLALKLSTRISTRLATKLLSNIPFAGPVVNAFFNAQTLRGMADSADKYYSNVLREDSLKA
ncbi:MAG: hypothetical protein Q9P44_16705 [Anaerolineae bacterium]|nr:hypothetical protein [Anaerolineae bacterium]